MSASVVELIAARLANRTPAPSGGAGAGSSWIAANIGLSGPTLLDDFPFPCLTKASIFFLSVCWGVNIHTYISRLWGIYTFQGPECKLGDVPTTGIVAVAVCTVPFEASAAGLGADANSLESARKRSGFLRRVSAPSHVPVYVYGGGGGGGAGIHTSSSKRVVERLTLDRGQLSSCE